MVMGSIYRGEHFTVLPFADCLVGNRKPKLEELSLAGAWLISKRMLQTLQPENWGEERNQWAGLTGGSFLDKVGAKIWGQIQIQAGVRVRRTAGEERLCQSPRAWGLRCGQPPSLAGAAGFEFRVWDWEAIHQMSPRRLPNQVCLTCLLNGSSHQEHQTQATRAQPGASRWPPVSWAHLLQTPAPHWVSHQLQLPPH